MTTYMNKLNQQQQLDMRTVTVPPGQEAGWDFSAWPEEFYGAVRSDAAAVEAAACTGRSW